MRVVSESPRGSQTTTASGQARGGWHTDRGQPKRRAWKSWDDLVNGHVLRRPWISYIFKAHRISTDRHDASFWLMIAKPPISFRAIYGSAVGCGIGCAAGGEPAAPDAPASNRSSRIRKSIRTSGTRGTRRAVTHPRRVSTATAAV